MPNGVIDVALSQGPFRGMRGRMERASFVSKFSFMFHMPCSRHQVRNPLTWPRHSWCEKRVWYKKKIKKKSMLLKLVNSIHIIVPPRWALCNSHFVSPELVDEAGLVGHLCRLIGDDIPPAGSRRSESHLLLLSTYHISWFSHRLEYHKPKSSLAVDEWSVIPPPRTTFTSQLELAEYSILIF